jgi:hypothetical protein
MTWDQLDIHVAEVEDCWTATSAVPSRRSSRRTVSPCFVVNHLDTTMGGASGQRPRRRDRRVDLRCREAGTPMETASVAFDRLHHVVWI